MTNPKIKGKKGIYIIAKSFEDNRFYRVMLTVKKYVPQFNDFVNINHTFCPHYFSNVEFAILSAKYYDEHDFWLKEVITD